MFIDIDGINVNYFEQGTGETVVFLHGWGVGFDSYSVLLQFLTNNYHVIAIDMPGCGQTAEPLKPWCVDDYVDFIIDFLKKKEISKAVLIGHSFGCRVIIKLLNRANLDVKVNKIIIMDGAGILPKRGIKYYFKTYSYKTVKKILSTGIIKSLFPDVIEKYRKKVGSADYLNSSEIMKATLIKVVNEDLTCLLPNIKVSSLLIWGENDHATPLSDGQKMEKLIPDAGLVIVKDAGHYSMFENWGQCRAVIDYFLKN